jgi:hypothetical protein
MKAIETQIMLVLKKWTETKNLNCKISPKSTTILVLNESNLLRKPAVLVIAIKLFQKINPQKYNLLINVVLPLEQPQYCFSFRLKLSLY